MPKIQPGAQYRTKNTSKLRTRVGVEGQRSILAYSEAAKRYAAKKNREIAQGWRRQHIAVEGEGEQLQNGLLAMADRLGATTQQYEKIASMDQEVLTKMYQNNDLTFEVFFNYDGIRRNDDGSYFVTETKRNDIEWFIRQYDRVAESLM